MITGSRFSRTLIPAVSHVTGSFADRFPLMPLGVTAAALALVAGCSPSVQMTADPPDSFSRGESDRTTYFGPAVAMGEGLARSYYVVQGGRAVELGVALTEGALRGLPELPGHAGEGQHHEGHDAYNEWLLTMHPENPTPYQFLEVNWNPDGHDPPGIYDAAHFDLHFYSISLAERDAIHPSDPEFAAKARNLPDPASAFEPAVYVPAVPPEADPADFATWRMGLHWIDVTRREFGPDWTPGVDTFDETFIYGSWDGEFIFAEPMMTKTFLEGVREAPFSRTLPRLTTGYGPGGYSVYWLEDRREYRIALTDLPPNP
jgi:hypothetical protein